MGDICAQLLNAASLSARSLTTPILCWLGQVVAMLQIFCGTYYTACTDYFGHLIFMWLKYLVSENPNIHEWFIYWNKQVASSIGWVHKSEWCISEGLWQEKAYNMWHRISSCILKSVSFEPLRAADPKFLSNMRFTKKCDRKGKNWWQKFKWKSPRKEPVILTSKYLHGCRC